MNLSSCSPIAAELQPTGAVMVGPRIAPSAATVRPGLEQTARRGMSQRMQSAGTERGSRQRATASPRINAALGGSGWQIVLCGGISVERNGRRLPAELPARQGRLVFAYLVLNRTHPISRDELTDVLWPGRPPVSPEAVLSGVLTRLRRALGDGVLRSSPSEVQLDLGSGAWIDVEVAAASVAAAHAALTAGDYGTATRGAREAAQLLEPRLLPEFEGAWLDARREELDQLRLRSLELLARGALEQTPADLGAAESAARELIRRAPYSETGYAALMQAHAARGDAVEAVRVFDQLRRLLRDEMGTTPSPTLIALNDRLLRHELPAKPRRERPRVPLPPPLRLAAQAPWIGRREPFELLAKSWRERRGAVFITGEPGIGKTRLVSQLAQLAHAEGGLVLYGRCDEQPVSSYQPFAELFGHYMDHADAAELQVRLPRETAELGRIVPRLAANTSPAERSEGDRHRLFEAVVSFLRHEATDRPVTIVLDDLHWADRSTLLLVRHLLRGMIEADVVVIGTFRDVERESVPGLVELLAGLRRERGYDRIRLEGLNDDETAELVRAMTASDPTARFSRRLRDLTAGNPFFIAETVRNVQQATNSVTPAVTDMRAAGVAEGVRDVLLDRLMRRSEPALAVLRVAAVSGRSFDLGVIAAVLEVPPEELLSAVEELIEARLIIEQPDPDSFAFSHDLVRETQYEQLTASRRVRLHERIGLALAERPGASANDLARHFFEARHLLGPQPAADHSLEAARAASSASAHEEAIEHYERALTVIEEAGGAPDATRCRLLLELGHELEQIHDIDRSRVRFAEAAELAKRAALPADQARAASGFAQWQRYGVVDQAAIELLEDALRALGEEQSPLRSEIMGRLATRLDPEVDAGRAEQLFDDALALARGLRDPDALLMLLPLAPYVFAGSDHLDQRLVLADEAVALTAGRREVGPAASAQIDRFLALFELGRIDEADEALRAYATLIPDLHHAWFEWQQLTAQGTRASLDGQLEEAERLISSAAALEREFDPEGVVETWAVQSFMLGRFSGRLQSVDEDAIRHCAAKYGHRPFWKALSGRLYAGLGREDEARECLEACLAADRIRRRSREWLPTVTLLLESALELEDRPRVRQLREVIEPYRKRVVVVERASATWGYVADILNADG